jgi:hypothetical protein
MFVFNDLIVLTKQKKTIMGKDNKDNFKAKFHLNEVKLIEMADSEGLIIILLLLCTYYDIY